MAQTLEDLLLELYNDVDISAEDAIKLKEQHTKQSKSKEKKVQQYKVVVQLTETETQELEFEATMYTAVQDIVEFYDKTGLVLSMPKSRLVYIDISEIE